jgi:citrate synthase
MPDPNSEQQLLTTVDAAALLGVKPATLYAYVSRGLLANHRAPDGRSSLFERSELERLRSRQVLERPGSDAKAGIQSRLTNITRDTFYYRGYDVLDLARRYSAESVAELLWTGQLIEDPPDWRPNPTAIAAARRVQDGLVDDTLPSDRLVAIVLACATVDHFRFDTNAAGAVIAGRELIATMVESLKLPSVASSTAPSDASLAHRLWYRLTATPPRTEDLALLNATLILLADHELSPSTLAVRVAAAFQADPYAAVLSGISTLSGARHGRRTLAARTLLEEIRESGTDPARVVSARLQRGDVLPSTDGGRYDGGPDPRAEFLLAGLEQTMATAGQWAVVDSFLTLVQRRGLAPPSIEFALAALTFLHEMPFGASELIFAIGRSVGWIAHLLEEYTSPSTFDLNAHYVGVEVGPS